MIKYKSKEKVINWIDEIKSAQDPETLSLLYIKNLKEEIKVLESQAKVLKQKLKTYNPYEKKKLASSTATFADKPPQQVHIEGKASDYAKYPTQLKLSGIFAQSNTFGSAPVKMEYIRELEALSEQLKKQNRLLQEKLNQQQHRQMSAAQPRSKFEGFDLVNSKLITSKEYSTRVFRDQRKQILQEHEQYDFTLEDRMIQNLMEEKALLETEIQGYKKTEKNRKSIKVEGFDFMQKIKIYDKSTIIYNAKLKPITLSKEEILEDQLVSYKDQRKKINITILKLNKMSDIEETINRIKTHKSVQGIVIVNNDGQIIRSTYGTERKQEGEAIARTIPALAAKAKASVRDLDPTNELTFLRIKSKNNEIMVAPDKEFLLIVVQGPKEDKKDDAE